MDPTNDVQQESCCILHIENKLVAKKLRQDVRPFGEAQWTAVLMAAQKRKKKQNFNSSIYHAVVQRLPEQLTANDGYHVECYKNFTAVPSEAAEPSESVEISISSTAHLRSSSTSDTLPSSSTGIFLQLCLFCSKLKKRTQKGIEFLGSCETLDACQTIQEAAVALKDDAMLSQVLGVDLVAKEAKYHHSCKSLYLLKAGRTIDRDGHDRGKAESSCNFALRNILAYIEQSVIVNKRPEMFSSVYEHYLDLCLACDETPLQSRSLARNVQTKFKERIKMHCLLGNKIGNVIFSAETAEDAIMVAYDYTATDERTLTKAALILRKHLLSVEKVEFPNTMTLDDLRDGDAKPPEIVVNFFHTLYGGLTDNVSDQLKRRANSTSQDALFIVKRGQVKPAKHIALGTSVKSITGSKKLVTVLNRFGHCISYSSLEELETATAEAILDRETTSPEGTIQLSPMGLAFDNFDELTQTLSGANTLHDTMGILYQNIPTVSMKPVESSTSSRRRPNTAAGKGPQQKKGSKKRSLDLPEIPLMPYRGVPKMNVFSYKNTDVFNLADPTLKARQMDLIWMMLHALGNGMCPMWVGFNATHYRETLPRQEVRYLPNLRQPITGLDVIQETLRITQRCAEECNQEYGIVTYDLNAAKPAMQIQATEKPTFDNIFIKLGTFHVEMVFFKAVGKLIADSGGTNMLTEADVLAPGSLNGFITGKHFNRCKRLHPILALAFEILHFLSFLETYENKDEIHVLLAEIRPGEEEELQSAMISSVFLACAAGYELYTEETRAGAHGSTAQFWMIYVDYIRQFHLLERSIRTNNLDLYIYTMTKITDLFFVTNHVNYCRWLTKFQLDLLNVDDSHPGLRDTLEQGAFTICRTNHPFSRCPVDLTLEQTINADAASRLTGITSSTNNYGARLRWMITKSTRASFIRLLQEMAGLVVNEDTTTEIRPTRVQRDIKDLNKVINQIKNSFNPFHRERITVPILYNIHTGKASSEVVREYLLKVPESGKAIHKEFIQACQIDPSRFEARIPKVQLKTFSDECATNRRTTDKRVAALKCTRDLMGRLAILASKRDIDLQHIFQFPLTQVPLSMCCPDGMMTKTDKSQLLKILEEKQDKERSSPQSIHAYIIDGQYLLHALPPNLPPTYGGLARSILFQALALSKIRIHIVFDDYPKPSLKAAERARRGAAANDCGSYIIAGPAQRRPKDMRDALKFSSFKKELPVFLANEWTDPSYAKVLGGCHVYLDVPEGECWHFYSTDGTVTKERVESLDNNHEEADTKVCLHALATDSPDSNIVVRASDTDIAVILLHHCNKFAATVWMDVGTASKRDRRFINLSSIAKSLGDSICAALPAFHAFTGCDYTSAFVRKGKKRPFMILEKSAEAQKAFSDIACDDGPSEMSQEILLNYTATMYGVKKAGTSLNSCRFQAFEKVYRPKSRGKKPLENLKGIDSSSIPPCESEVKTHIKRAAFIARIWSHASEVTLYQHPLESDGWELYEGEYTPIWFEGPQLPESLVPEDEIESDDETIICGASSDEDTLSDEEEGVD